MLFSRKWTTPGHEYPGIEFVERPVSLSSPNSASSIIAPAAWSQNAVDILATKYMRRSGIPKSLTRVKERMVPDWLWRSMPADFTTDADFVCGESDARQVFTRLAGCWTYWGWKLGYFAKANGQLDPANSEDRARVFFDEVLYALAAQLFAPASPQWFNTGLHWAYGIVGPATGQWGIYHCRNEHSTFTDQRDGDEQAWEKSNGYVFPLDQSFVRPGAHACFLISPQDTLLGSGGIYDTLEQEARVFKYGGGVGGNWSKLRGSTESLSGGGVSSGLLSWLRIADAGGGSIKSGGVTRRAAKMVCIDVDHPDIEEFITWKSEEEWRVASMLAGDRLLRSVVPVIKSGVTGGMDGADVMTEPEMRFVPPAARRRAELAGRQQTEPVWPEKPYTDHFDNRYSAYNGAQGQNANNSVRLTNQFMEAAFCGWPWELKNRVNGQTVKTVKADYLWNLICRAAWTCADPGVQFDTTINEWNTCPADGRINTSNPCSEFHFLDDNACNLASLKLTSFTETGTNGQIKGFDAESFIRCTELVTVILDITVSMAGYPSDRVAEACRKYRTLGIGYADLGAFLMRSGVAYGSEAGRAWCAVITSLMHSTATVASAVLATELGSYPRWDDNRSHHMRVVRNHTIFAERLYGKMGRSYEDLTVEPPDVDTGAVQPWLLMIVAQQARDAELAAASGLRNAQLTLLAPTGTIGLVLDCDTTGIEPDFSLVKDKKLVGGGYMRIVNQSIPAALAALGYTDFESQDVCRYVFGTRLIPDAGILDGSFLTMNVLRDAGLTDQELERFQAAVVTSASVEHAARMAVTRERWVEIIGCDGARLDDPAVSVVASMLVAVGAVEPRQAFDRVDVIDAVVFGRGTVEGAPGLKEEHYPVFDCANRCGMGKRFLTAEEHVLMMAAAQPSLSGGISKTINLPWDASVEDVAAVYRRSWELMTKCAALYVDGSKMSQPLTTSGQRVDRRIAFPRGEQAGMDDGDGSEDVLPMGAVIQDLYDEQEATAVPEASANGVHKSRPVRSRLPGRRAGYTQKFKLGGHTFYVRTGEYADGRLGEIFIDCAKEGSGFRSVGHALAIAVSLGLQHGVPLEEYVEAFVGMRFEPAGVVQHHDRIKMSSSFLDAIFRDLAVTYLKRDELAHVQVAAPEPEVPFVPEPTDPNGDYADDSELQRFASAARAGGYSGEMCPRCHSYRMKRTGPCRTCDNCGANDGCG